MLRFLFYFIWAVSPIFAHSQTFIPPESGKTVDQRFQVALMQKLPNECVAWHIRGAELNVKVVIAKTHLEEYIALVPQNHWDSRSLQKLLANKPKGSSGCVELVFDDISFVTMPFDMKVAEGQAMVLDGNGNFPAPYALIHYSSDAAFGGHIFYSIPGQRPFRASLWWIR